MASSGNQLPLFFLLVLVISPQIQAREGKFFSLFTHFRTIYNAKDPLAKSPTLAPTPEPMPAPEFAPGPAPELVTEPTQTPTPTPASAPGPSISQAIGSTIPSGPAPEPEFFESGEGYGLYGRGSYSQYSPTKETPATTTTFGNELLNDDISGESYKPGHPETNFYNNNEEYRNNDNTNEEYRNSYNMNYVDSYSNNNNDKESYYYYNNNNNNYYNSNGYEGKREGMSDTRFMKNGKYFYNINSHNENYNLNGFKTEGGSTQKEGYYEKSQYPNEFDTMEEYERQQEEQGYTP